MSQCAAILEVLADREWHTVADVHRQAGYSRLNSRVSELRARGHDIECETTDGERAVDRYRYRLVSSPALDTTDRHAAVTVGRVERAPSAATPLEAGALEPGQLTFDDLEAAA